MPRSVEEKVKQWVYSFFSNNHSQIASYSVDRDSKGIDRDISNALQLEPSKQGGPGGGLPDSQIMLKLQNEKIPVIMEFKGKQGKLVKKTKNGMVELFDAHHELKFSTINAYAVNGAVYYSSAVLKHVSKFKYILAVGVNGNKNEAGEMMYECGCYLLSLEDRELPIHLGDFSDLSFLLDPILNEKISSALETPEEIELRVLDEEQRYKTVLKDLNQNLRDTQSIAVSQRVDLVVACIMAALGSDKVSPLEIDELKGSTEDGCTDGNIVRNKAKNYLVSKKLPERKVKQVVNILSSTLENGNIDIIPTGEEETPIKSTYRIVKGEIVPLLVQSKRNDFMGRLFDTMYQWVTVPDGDENDVVLTPRYVATLMARLAEVDMKSYVWDWALGSGGLLIAAMNEMIADAEERLATSPAKFKERCKNIREQQLMGVERLPNIYVLAVLNMILMGDGSTGIIQEDSVKNFDGNYADGSRKFPANVLLINPPYSAPGNGMNFLEAALKKMDTGRAVIIIQDSAGKGKAVDYNKSILRNNRLLASIKMPKDLFPGRVQTSIYVFEVGKKHKPNMKVKFIDFRNDGYMRMYRHGVTFLGA